MVELRAVLHMGEEIGAICYIYIDRSEAVK
jgi:hypothetical protein